MLNQRCSYLTHAMQVGALALGLIVVMSLSLACWAGCSSMPRAGRSPSAARPVCAVQPPTKRALPALAAYGPGGAIRSIPIADLNGDQLPEHLMTRVGFRSASGSQAYALYLSGSTTTCPQYAGAFWTTARPRALGHRHNGLPDLVLAFSHAGNQHEIRLCYNGSEYEPVARRTNPAYRMRTLPSGAVRSRLTFGIRWSPWVKIAGGTAKCVRRFQAAPGSPGRALAVSSTSACRCAR